MKVTRVWKDSTGGFWYYSCSCRQYQDGWDYCFRHKEKGYTAVLKELTDTSK